MSAWAKLSSSGVIAVDQDTTLQVIVKSAPSVFPALTDVPNQSYPGPTSKSLYTAPGSDVYFRLQPLADAANDGLSASKVPATRTLTASGLLTGGGDLSADRTLSVPKASSGDAAAGTDDAKAMTALQTFNAISAYLAALPTVDPHVNGKPWNNAGTVKISAG